MTNLLACKTFGQDLEKFLENAPGVKTVRFKNLLLGKDDKERQWIAQHSLTANMVGSLLSNLQYRFPFQAEQDGKTHYTDGKVDLVWGASGKYEYYDQDLLISRNRVMNYQEQVISLENKKAWGVEYANRIWS